MSYNEDRSGPVEDNKESTPKVEKIESEAIPLGPATQAIIILSIN